MRAGKSQFHNFFKSHVTVFDLTGARVHDNDASRIGARRSDEPFDPRFVQIHQIIWFHELICPAPFLEENSLVIVNLGKLVERSTGDGRLAPLDLPIIEGQFVIAIRLERDKPLGTPRPKVERFIKPNILEITGGEDGKQTEIVIRIAPRRGENLPTKGNGIRNFQFPEFQAIASR